MTYDSLVFFRSLHIFLQLFFQINLCNGIASLTTCQLFLSDSLQSKSIKSENNLSCNYKHLTIFIQFCFSGYLANKVYNYFNIWLHVEEQSFEYALSDHLGKKNKKKSSVDSSTRCYMQQLSQTLVTLKRQREFQPSISHHPWHYYFLSYQDTLPTTT